MVRARHPGRFPFWGWTITSEQRRFYVYADESGQDTVGRLFVVAIVLVDRERRDAVEERFSKMEERVRGPARKWSRTEYPERAAFTRELPVLAGAGVIFAWAAWDEGFDYPTRTGEAVARSVAACCPDANLTIIVDGLSSGDRPKVASALRWHGARRKISLNSRDEVNPLLRLADGVAGFVRDFREGAPYAVVVWPTVQAVFSRV